MCSSEAVVIFFSSLVLINHKSSRVNLLAQYYNKKKNHLPSLESWR